MKFPWEWQYVWQALPLLLEGLKMTLFATFWGSIFTFILGLVWFMLRLANLPIISPVANFLVQFLRGTPLLIQLYFVFYVFPTWGLTLSPILCGIIGLAIFNSAPMSEVYRAGIEAIPKGQWEASQTLGIPIRQVWSRIMLPQALRTVLPMMGNLIIVMFKETAILSTITIAEMMTHAVEFSMLSYRYVEPLTLAACFYFVHSYTSSHAVRWLERRIALNA
ncbi:MAG: ectoine/hydroxyectoine ABC transporter permease subunit EhuD [Dehalococcoidia bacterium]